MKSAEECRHLEAEVQMLSLRSWATASQSLVCIQREAADRVQLLMERITKVKELVGWSGKLGLFLHSTQFEFELKIQNCQF